MTADERPERTTAEQQRSADVRDALLAVDLKRLIKASQDNDDEIVSEVRARYITE